jgi:Activator of Hsp90 ATPase homolog 1-like protein
MIESADGPQVRIERVLPAPIQDVFDAWTDPARMTEWLSPVGHAEVEVDLRVMGRFKVSMIGEVTRIEHTGEYLVVNPLASCRSPGSRSTPAPRRVWSPSCSKPKEKRREWCSPTACCRRARWIHIPRGGGP